MARVKRSVHARKKRRKVLEEAKGYFGLKKSNYTYAKEQVERSLAYAYRDRKVRKREFRKLWIMRINAGARANGLSYNQFMAGLKAANVELDRKVLADLAIADPAKFGEIVAAGEGRAGANRRAAAAGDLRAAGRLLRRPLAAVCARVPSSSPATRGSPALHPISSGTCRCGCSAGCTTSCSAARRRGTTSTRRSSGTRGSCAAGAREQEVQTNEVQRSWALLPAFLSLADGRPFDLLELGPSAGLNLLWDRYAYRVLVGDVGERRARAARRRPRAAAGARCSSGASKSRGGAAST